MATPIPPILRLPDELFVEITAAGQNRIPPFKHPRSEVVASQICHRFRRAVTGASTLWTRVPVFDLCDESVQLAPLYFERSAACEIAVTLVATGHLEALHKGLRYLAPHIGRIARLSIHSTQRMALDTILASFRNVLVPNLRYLAIQAPNSYMGLPLDLSPLSAPNLVNLTLSGLNPSFPPPQCMSTLTYLEIRHAPPEFHEFASQLVSLNHLHLAFSMLSSTPGRQIISQSLTRLDLDFHNGRVTAVLDELTVFNTPNLTQLCIRHTHGDQLSVFFNNSRLSFPAVTSVAFITSDDNDRVCNEDQDLQAGYQTMTTSPSNLFPSVSSLTLIHECLASRIVSDLFGTGSQPWRPFKVLALRPMQGDVEKLYAALQDAVHWKGSQEEPLPVFKLSSNLFERGVWVEDGVHVELLEDDGSYRCMF